MMFGHCRIRVRDRHCALCLEVVAAELVELRIQLDRLELFLPVRRCCLPRTPSGGSTEVSTYECRLDGRSLLLDGVGDGYVVGKFLAVLHLGRNTPATVAETVATGPSSRMRDPMNPVRTKSHV